MNRASYLPAIHAQLLSGGAIPQLPFPEALSQTFKKGDWVFLVAGYLTICASDPAAGIAGIAMEDAHNAAAGLYQINVALFTSQTLIEMSVYHVTAGNCKIEAVDMGTVYNAEYVSAGLWRVDKGTSDGTSQVRIVHFLDEVGALKGRVCVNILPGYRLFV